jgi:hypothetical protein
MNAGSVNFDPRCRVPTPSKYILMFPPILLVLIIIGKNIHVPREAIPILDITSLLWDTADENYRGLSRIMPHNARYCSTNSPRRLSLWLSVSAMDREVF